MAQATEMILSLADLCGIWSGEAGLIDAYILSVYLLVVAFRARPCPLFLLVPFL